MRFRPPTLLALAAATLVAASAGAQSVRVLNSDLPGPFNGAPELAARAAAGAVAPRLGLVDPKLGLELERVYTAGSGGHIVRLRQTHAGLPVIDATIVVRLGANGEVLRVSSNAVPVSDLDLEPVISRAEAGRIARAAVPLLLPEADTTQARLAIQRIPGGRLVWQVYVPTVLPIHTIHALVDAKTGELIGWDDLAKHVKANLFATGADAKASRKVTGEFDLSKVSELDLHDIVASGLGQPLTGPDVVARNCCPTENCEGGAAPKKIDGTLNYQGFTFDYEAVICHELQLAAGDQNGDYKYEPAREPTQLTTAIPYSSDGDEFSEVMGYHWAQQTIAAMRELDPQFEMGPDSKPLMVTTNFLIPDVTQVQDQIGWPLPAKFTITRLLRLSNAMFAPKGTFEQIPLAEFQRDHDSVIMFQGNTHDFAYDGSVVSHEVGHAIVHGSAPNALHGWVVDEWGAMDDPGAMNEGFADYFAAVVTGSHKVGEYVGAGGSGGEGALRNLENELKCPDVLWGEVHQDSMHFSAALWALRGKLASDDASRKKFDRAVLDTIRGLNQGDGFASTSEVLASEIEAAFGEAGRDAAEAEFAARGLSSCERVVDLAEGRTQRQVFIAPRGGPLSPYAPGPFQFRLTPPKGATTVVVSVKGGVSSQGLSLPGMGGGGGSSLGLLLKEDAPIVFAAGATITSDAASSNPQLLSGQGDQTTTLPLTFEVCDGKEVYFALTNGSQEGQWHATEINVGYTIDEAKAEACPEPEPDPDPNGNDGGDNGGGGGVREEVPCGCATGSPLVLAPLGLLLAALRRKRHAE